MYQFNIGDKVWHINQLYYDSVIVKPFVVKARYVYNDGLVDYVIQLDQVHMLANASDLVKVVK